MKLILTNSPEHKALIIETIKAKDFFLLRQLKEAANSKLETIVLIETYFDMFIHTSCDEAVKTQFAVYTNESVVNSILKFINLHRTE